MTALPTNPDPASSVPPSPAAAPAATRRAKPENLLLNLVCTVGIPTLILSKFSGDKILGPIGGLLIALTFPIGYGVYDFTVRRRANFIAIVGFVSVLISGGFGVLKVGGFLFAVKDAAIPTIIGLGVLLSMRAKTPLIHELLFNPQVLDVEKVNRSLREKGNEREFAKLLERSSYFLAFSFLISAILNFFLARYLLVSPPGTEAFNGELAKMHCLSWPVIVVPSMGMMMFAFWRLMNRLQRRTGFTLEGLF